MNKPYETTVTRQLARSVVIDVCPEEEPFFEFINNGDDNKRKRESELAFGIEAGGAVLTVVILDAVRAALAETWEILKPTLKQSVSEGAERIKDAFFNRMSKILAGEASGAEIMLNKEDVERVVQAARRSAIRNGCNSDQVEKIANSLRRSLQFKRG